jgi:hypothetical protein
VKQLPSNNLSLIQLFSSNQTPDISAEQHQPLIQLLSNNQPMIQLQVAASLDTAAKQQLAFVTDPKQQSTSDSAGKQQKFSDSAAQ